MRLNELKPGQSARIETVGGEGALRQHFLDMGVIPGTEVTLVKLAPMGDPMELRIHGYELTLRLADAGEIGITLLDSVSAANADDKEKKDHVPYKTILLQLKNKLKRTHVPQFSLKHALQQPGCGSNLNVHQQMNG